MRELLPDLERWQQEGKPVALATVVQKTGPSLRPLGAKLAVTNTEEIAGSVSGGCVEAAVYEEAQQVIQTGQPRLLHYGVSDETAWSVGLSCGGSIEVLVESLAAESVRATDGALRQAIRQEEPVALVTIVGGAPLGGRLLAWPDGRTLGSLGEPELDRLAASAALERFRFQDPCRLKLPASQGEVDVYIEVHSPLPRLVVIGAVHIAIPLVNLAKTLGYRILVLDPRSAFNNRQRFPQADELLVGWPAETLQKMRLDETCSLVFLSHDEKIDLPALQVALNSRASYIGALGSRRTHARRVAALLEMGVPEGQLARIHAPVGLDIGAIHPEEIALAVLAEMVAVRHRQLQL